MNVLIVDDHPMIIDSYISIISSINNDFNFFSATNCENAYYLIQQIGSRENKIDIGIFDIGLPPFKEKKIFNGTDLAINFKRNFPNSKIMMITMYQESLIINKVLKKINPHGFLNKSDISYHTFSKVFEAILSGKSFFSKTINNTIAEFNKQQYDFDEIDIEIITLLEKGIKTKELYNYLPIKQSAIEKRKAKIKLQIINSMGTDLNIIENARLLKLI